MRVPIYIVILPIMAIGVFAQNTPPTQPKQGADAQAPAKTSEKASDRSQEMKTQTYSGTLMDGSCAGSGSAATTSNPSSSNSTAAAGSTTSAAPANRSAGSGGSQSCTVSAGTTQFAMRMKDGNTVRFDDVGNARVQDAIKTRKKWSDSVSANKPIQVKASGVLNGDKLTVLSVD